MITMIMGTKNTSASDAAMSASEASSSHSVATPVTENATQSVDNQQIIERRAKLKSLRDRGINPYPNDFRRDAFAGALHALYDAETHDSLEQRAIAVKVAGRIMAKRVMGKASFVHIQDMTGRLQIYLRRDDLSPETYEDFKTWDLGDIIGVSGTLFKTKTDELSVKAAQVQLLTKALHPLPEKFHGLTDHEVCYRQRYLDLIANEDTRRVFTLRSKIVSALRRFFDAKGFLEVETPMMQPIAGGALARPFVTHHNALDMELYLRIAPELFLKRLVVGGIERVYELNRCFRNEGISVRHNPEFTMIEFYMAYADYRDLMDLTEQMLRELAEEVLGTMKITSQGREYDLSKPFQRLTVKNAILKFNPDLRIEDIENLEKAKKVAANLGITLLDDYGLGKIQMEIFEKTVEKELFEPTFIVDYPLEVSPLARKKDSDPFLTDRFEFFIGGREVANGFSELNDADDQAERFRKQAAAHVKGDAEAMRYDADYITALEYGMPPTAGEGIGIDRLVMLFADVPSIRDVILFPLLRP